MPCPFPFKAGGGRRAFGAKAFWGCGSELIFHKAWPFLALPWELPSASSAASWWSWSLLVGSGLLHQAPGAYVAPLV